MNNTIITGKIVDWFNDKTVLESFQDQFAPYESYGMDKRVPFSGISKKMIAMSS